MRREANVVGVPIRGFESIGAVTSEDDWVVTGVHRGVPFKRYVSPHVTDQVAMQVAASGLRLTPDGLEWISVRRRHEVERCVRMDGDWLRSRAR